MSLHLVALIISIYFPPEFGGGATGAWNRAMALHKLGYKIYVICGFPAYPSGRVKSAAYRGKIWKVEKMEFFTVIRIRLLPIAHEGYLKRLIVFTNFIILVLFYLPWILHLAGQITLVYARSPVLFCSLAGLVYSGVSKAFYIYEVPDLWPESLIVFPSHFSRLINFMGKFVAKLSYSFPDMIITTTNGAAEHIRTIYTPHAPVQGVPVGVDTKKFSPSSKDECRETLIAEGFIPSHLRNKFILLYSGTISEAQKVETLAELSERLRAMHDDSVEILVIGEGSAKSKLEFTKEEKNLQNFQLLPPQPRNKMAHIISACDCCIVMLAPEPIFRIVVPNKLYEYIACRKPIIGVCDGELANIIRQRKIGYVIGQDKIEEFAQIVITLSHSPEVLLSMESNAAIALKELSIDGISERFKEILAGKVI